MWCQEVRITRKHLRGGLHSGWDEGKGRSCATNLPFVSPQSVLGNVVSQKVSGVKFLTFMTSVADMRREIEMEFGLACCPLSAIPGRWWWWWVSMLSIVCTPRHCRWWVLLFSGSAEDRTWGMACTGQTLSLNYIPDLWWDYFYSSWILSSNK